MARQDIAPLLFDELRPEQVAGNAFLRACYTAVLVTMERESLDSIERRSSSTTRERARAKDEQKPRERRKQKNIRANR